jgi:hypothetical protein
MKQTGPLRRGTQYAGRGVDNRPPPLDRPGQLPALRDANRSAFISAADELLPDAGML